MIYSIVSSDTFEYSDGPNPSIVLHRGSLLNELNEV